jgi:membrane associated rhomboid family serine protease
MAIEETVELLSNLTEEEANTYALVLTSHGLPYAVRRTTRGWEIRVPATLHDAACSLVDAYREENPRPPVFEDSIRSGPAAQPGFSGVWVSLMLLAVHLAVRSTSDPDAIVMAAGASAGAILSGDFFRAATALTLHGDFIHLAGNIFGIAVFASAVCNLTGAGVGWLMILTAGIFGNLANAWLVPPGHVSVGASTAVFGAVGILAAIQFYRKRRAGDSRLRAWLPFAGGLALLAFLGSGEHADITAHLFGFVIGTAAGWVYVTRTRRPPDPKTQRRLLVLSGAIMAVSWLAALS